MVTQIGSKHPTQLFIKERMKSLHLDQKRLAERMGCEPATISRLLTGKMEMTTSWLARFADALDVSVLDLFRHPDMPTRDELLGMGTPDELRQAIQLIRMAKGDGTNG